MFIHGEKRARRSHATKFCIRKREKQIRVEYTSWVIHIVWHGKNFHISEGGRTVLDKLSKGLILVYFPGKKKIWNAGLANFRVKIEMR